MKLDLADKYKPLLDTAMRALHERTFFTHYPENPSPDIDGEHADKEGRERYEAHLHRKFGELLQQ